MRTGIFISHAHEDHELAKCLCELLMRALDVESDAITCTSDPNHGLDPGGGHLSNQINSRLNSARAVFLLATHVSLDKAWVRHELAVAAEASERGEMKLYIITPTVRDRGAVPSPYQTLPAVTMSNALEAWAFVRRLRGERGGAATGDSSAWMQSLLEFQHQCQEREQCDTEARHRTAVKQARGGSWIAIAAACAAAILVVLGMQRHYDAELETQRTTAVTELAEKLAQAQEKSNAELRSIPFSGFFRDSKARPLPCDTVVARPASGTVQAKCIAGVFTFTGAELKADPFEAIPLIVHMRNGEGTGTFHRGTSPVAIDLQGIPQ